MKMKEIFFLLLLFEVSIGQDYENLPGLDVLSAGFDAATWEGKENRNAIFDFSSDPFSKKHIPSIDKSYMVPASITVVTHGACAKKVEESCVAVDTHFEDYVKTYQSSVSLSVAVKVDNFSMGINANKEARKAYEAITTKGQAIGWSESWWGVYQATAPPAFIMTDQLAVGFKKTLASLKNIGIPKTEAEQLKYNEALSNA